jgi:1,4-dihydroxy-6-naphthoate synthase
LVARKETEMDVRIAHSPDSDDAFMFYALAAGVLQTGEYRFTHILDDIESLNRKALDGEYEVTAVSIHAYAYLSEKYALLSCGASMGDRYGPLIVARDAWGPNELKCRKIAVPGTMTSAYLAAKLFEPELEHVVVPFDKIIDAIRQGDVDGGVLIHEGQLTYGREGLKKVVDLGEWWFSDTGLPLPLGGNVIRRDLGHEHMKRIASIIRQSIQYGLNHRRPALEHALGYARGLDSRDADRFVSMYVNDRTLDYGDDGRMAVQLLLDRAFSAGLIARRVSVDFVG